MIDSKKEIKYEYILWKKKIYKYIKNYINYKKALLSFFKLLAFR